jgi:hypothetical protein
MRIQSAGGTQNWESPQILFGNKKAPPNLSHFEEEPNEVPIEEAMVIHGQNERGLGKPALEVHGAEGAPQTPIKGALHVGSNRFSWERFAVEGISQSLS